MLAFGDLLRRFRLGGVPGAPSTAGVPVDRGAEFDEELAPVWAALAGAETQAAQIAAAAQARAESIRAEAAARARLLVDEAVAQSPAEQAATAARRLAQTGAERARVLNAGATGAERIDRVSGERLAPLVDALVERILGAR